MVRGGRQISTRRECRFNLVHCSSQRRLSMAKHPHSRSQPFASDILRAVLIVGLMLATVICLPAFSWGDESPTAPSSVPRTTVTAELLSEEQIEEEQPRRAAPPKSPMHSLETQEEPGWIEPPEQETYADISYQQHPTGFRRIFRPLFYSLSSDGRSRGIGNPLTNESWLNRPFHVDLLAGGIFVPSLLRNRVDAGAGFLFGARFGWDGSHFWGVEARMADAHLGLSNPALNSRLGNARVFLWDVNWLYYPLGDTQWRPFISAGTGLTNFDFTDNKGSRTHDVVLSIPMSLGLKYRVDNRMAFRIELQDHLTFASGNRIDTLNSLVITSGVEMHFGGGPRKSYWPWTPSRAWW
jgi:hypothetical protein